MGKVEAREEGRVDLAPCAKWAKFSAEEGSPSYQCNMAGKGVAGGAC
jgi:hypothetical protein